MKLVPFQSLPTESREQVGHLLGVWNKRPVVVASKDSTGRWNLLQDRNNRPVSRNANLIRVRTFESRQQVLDYFSKHRLTPYCKAEEEKERQRRRCYRKQVNLAGEYRLERIGGGDEILIEDLSFEGLKFYSFSAPETLRVGDVLTLRFTLDDRRRSTIRKQAVVVHITDKHVGVQFVQSENDPRLGFYLR
jgi:hypothetical protein